MRFLRIPVQQYSERYLWVAWQKRGFASMHAGYAVLGRHHHFIVHLPHIPFRKNGLSRYEASCSVVNNENVVNRKLKETE